MDLLNDEKLIVVPSTAVGFRVAVSLLRSLAENEGMIFQTFTLLVECCVCLLVKNLGRGMPEIVVREKLESLNICVQGVTQLRSAPRDADPTNCHLPNPLFVSVSLGYDS